PDAPLPVLGLRADDVRALREEPGAGWQRRLPLADPLGGRGIGRRGLRSDRRATVEGPGAADQAAARVDGPARGGDRDLRRDPHRRRVRRAAVRRLLLLLPRQDLDGYDHAASDAGRFPWARVRAV